MSQYQMSSEAAQRNTLRELARKQALPLLGVLGLAAVLVSSAKDLDLPAIVTHVAAIAPHQWAFGLVGVAMSFVAMAKMEVVVHRFLATGLRENDVVVASMTAVGTAQMVGFGLLSGTLARWRMLPEAGLLQAAKITALVSVCFMLSLGAVTAIMVLITGPEAPWARALAAFGLVCVAALIGVTLWKPRRILGWHLPPLRAQAQLLGYTALDTVAAALTLYVLIPTGPLPEPAQFFTAFLISMGLGLLGATPGGLGPFEFAMLAFLPMLPEDPMLAAIMGYRMIYFALPATLAFCALIFAPLLRSRSDPPARAKVSALRDEARPVAALALSYNAPRAETGLIRQGEFDILVDETGRALSLVAPTGQSLIMLADPLNRQLSAPRTLRALSEAATGRMLCPALYKCDARTAIAARHAGWQVLKVSHEAVIDPAAYKLDTPARKQLRRFLRKAETAGVTITEAGPVLPVTRMRAVAEAWAKHRHGARGFSMGQFEDSYVAGQRIYLAHQEGKLIAFMSFHESWRERTLDLMCTRPDTPSGTTHALLHAAIEGAREDALARVSLAAVPCLADSLPLPDNLADRIRSAMGTAGLKRFKSSFAPRWESLYMAAPTRIGLTVVALDLADRITRPRSVLLPDS